MPASDRAIFLRATRDSSTSSHPAATTGRSSIGARPSGVHDLHQSRDGAESFDDGVDRNIIGHLERATNVEPHDDLVGVEATGAVLISRIGGAANQLARDGVAADELTFVLQLDLAGDSRQRSVDVGDARDDVALTCLNRAPLRVRHDVLENGDRHPLGNPGALVDTLVVPRFECDALDHLGDEVRNAHFSGATRGPRFLVRDHHAELDGLGIVRGHLAPDAILERRDDLAAGGVVLGIRGEADHDIERQPHRIAFDLDVAFLHDVEEADLDLSGQIGKLVEREDSAI